MKPIPQEWIRSYVDMLLKTAALFPAGSEMRTAALLRADNVLDLVKAFQESEGQ